MSESNSVLWWPDELSIPGSCRPKVLEPGEILSRYSQLDPLYDEGVWLEPADVSKEARLVNVFNSNLVLRRFKLLKPLHVEASNATPWFDMKGRGRQYRILETCNNELGMDVPMHIRDLVIRQYMVEIDENGQVKDSGRILDDDEFCHHWKLDPEISVIERYDDLRDAPDGVYAVSEWRAIFVKDDGNISPVSSYRRDFYLLQQLHFLFFNENLNVDGLSETDLDRIKYVLYPAESQEDFIDILSEISDVFHLDMDTKEWQTNILNWRSGDRNSLDQVYTIDPVAEEEYRVLYWERGVASEVIRLFGLSHVYEFVLNYYCRWV